MTQNWYINSDSLNKFPSRFILVWALFLTEESKSAITKCNNLSTSSLNRVFWKHLKAIIKDDICLNNFINIANTCINLGYWLLYFKILLSIIISKPNMTSYNSPKMFWLIILLNMFRKLIEKVIGKRLQF